MQMNSRLLDRKVQIVGDAIIKLLLPKKVTERQQNGAFKENNLSGIESSIESNELSRVLMISLPISAIKLDKNYVENSFR